MRRLQLLYNELISKLFYILLNIPMSLTADESTFSTEVLESSIPVIVHFRAPWCGVCRLVEPLLQTLQDEWLGYLRLVDVNADDNLRLANQYRLTTLPTLMIFQDGEIRHRIEAFSGRDDLRATLSGYIQRLNQGLYPFQQAIQVQTFREVSSPEG